MWKAIVSEDPGTFRLDVRLVDAFDDHVDVAQVDVNGVVTTHRQNRGVEVPRMLSIPHEALDALRDAINGHAPPSDDRDLRDALAIERRRVDKILEGRQ